VLVCWVLLLVGQRFEHAVLGFLTPPPPGVQWLVTVVWWAGTVGLISAVAVLAAVAALVRRPAMARDVLAAGFAAWLLAYLVVTVVGPVKGASAGAPTGAATSGFPQVLLAVTVAVGLAAAPYLTFRLRRTIHAVIVLVALDALVHGSALVVSAAAALALGWGVAAAVALAFGSQMGLPSAGDVAALLEDLGVPVQDVKAADRQEWGVARYVASQGSTSLSVSLYGRDARDAQLVAKTVRYALYRDSGPTLALTRLQQVEHEAYLTLSAGAAGAAVPAVVRATRGGPAGDAVLVTRSSMGRPLRELVRPPSRGQGGEGRRDDEGGGEDGDEGGGEDDAHGSEDYADGDLATPALDDGVLDAFMRHVLALRRAGIAHGNISTDSVLVVGDGVVLTDFRQASSGASSAQMDRDMACALAALALVAGPRRTVEAAQRVLPPEVLAQALPFLARAALSPSLSRHYRGVREVLSQLREQGARSAGVDVPKLAEPRRISLVNLALVAGTLIGGWALVGVLVNVGKSFGTIAGADWGWVIAVALLGSAAYPALAVQTLGAVVESLPYARVVALELADTFVALAGGTMAVLATRVRFFQQQGLSATLAVSSGVLISTVSWVVKAALFLIAVPFGIGSLHLSTSSTGPGRTIWLLVVVVAVVALALGVVLAVPRLRRLARDRLRPHVTDVRRQFVTLLASPRKLWQIFGGAVAAQLLVVLALGAALGAFGAHLSLATLFVVVTLASVLGGVSPVPGGVGVVEAGMILGLTSAGVEQSVAVAAVFVQRLFTSYLPPVVGWFSLVAMRRREYL
jgi:glycosyltransferase 2 family protein